MKKNMRLAIGMIALALLIVVAAGSMFTTIYNPPADTTVAPVFEQEYFDALGNKIPNIHTATISGTVTFRAVVTNAPSPEVADVRLTISYYEDGASGDTVFGVYTFTRDLGVDRPTYELRLDTTAIPNGEYTFTFSYSVVGESSRVTFSSLVFNFENGDGTSSAYSDMIMVLLLAGVAVLVVVYAYKKRK